MDNDKDIITKLFKSGATIKGLTIMIYNQMREREKLKNKSERAKINLNDVKNMVESTIYQSFYSKSE